MVKPCKSAWFVQQSINNSLLPSDAVHFCHWCMADWQKPGFKAREEIRISWDNSYRLWLWKEVEFFFFRITDTWIPVLSSCPRITGSFSSGLQTDLDFPAMFSSPLLVWDIDSCSQGLSTWKTMLNASPKWDYSLRIGQVWGCSERKKILDVRLETLEHGE